MHHENQHIKIISEGLCDSDAENTAVHHGSKLHFEIY